MVDGGASGAAYAIVFAAPRNKNKIFVVYEPNKRGSKNVNDRVVKLMYSVKTKYKNRNAAINMRAACMIRSSCRHLLFPHATQALVWVVE